MNAGLERAILEVLWVGALFNVAALLGCAITANLVPLLVAFGTDAALLTLLVMLFRAFEPEDHS